MILQSAPLLGLLIVIIEMMMIGVIVYASIRLRIWRVSKSLALLAVFTAGLSFLGQLSSILKSGDWVARTLESPFVLFGVMFLSLQAFSDNKAQRSEESNKDDKSETEGPR